MKKADPEVLMSLSGYSRHRQVNRSHISRLAAAGVLIVRTTPSGRKLVDVARSDAVLNDVPDVTEEPPRPASDGQQPRTSYAEARTILVVFQAKIQRLLFEEKQGKLIECEAVRQRIAEHVDVIRAGLAELTDRLAPLIAPETDAKRIHSMLRTAIVDELRRVATVVIGGGVSSGSPEV